VIAVRLRIPSRAGVQRRAAKLYRKMARAEARRRLRTLPSHAKVQLGCGERPFPGWINVDLERSVRPDVRLDLRGGFPAPADSVAFVFSEHVFEHLTLEDGQRILADCHTALEPGGVMRVAMPDLRYIVDRYVEGKSQGDIAPEATTGPGYSSIDSPARLLNYALRSWGHLYLYDVDELCLRMREAGFSRVEPREFGQSEHAELSDRESRPESRLVVEATK
jgi:predicted SAM-dependent methyltransferase